MKKSNTSFGPVTITGQLLYWTALIVPVSVATGSLVALFLWLLDRVTATRRQ
jgi:hypothetical protein